MHTSALCFSSLRRLLEAAKNLMYQTALSVAYGAGLRVSEVTALKVSDVDSLRMLLRVEKSKSSKIAMRYCRRCCSSGCVRGGASPMLRARCYRAVIYSGVLIR